MLIFDLANNQDMQVIFDKVLTMEINGNIFDVIHEIENAFQLYPFKDATIISGKDCKKIITIKNT